MNNKIESVRLFKQDDLYYLDIYMVAEDEHKTEYLHIPKVRFPIESAILYQNKGFCCGVGYDPKPHIIMPSDYFCEKAQVPEIPEDDEVYYTLKTVDKIIEVTQEEIEKS